MKIVIGNYKMQVGTRESVALARGVLHGIRGSETLPDIVICPTFTALGEVRKVIARSHIALGAQDLAVAPSGPLTGEVSAKQLSDAGCTYTLVGHSERRLTLGETDNMVHEKLQQALAQSMTPVLCVGETKAVREAGDAESFVAGQVMLALQGVRLPKRTKLIVAYEPVWAIGSGTPATVADALAMHRVIRRVVHETTEIDDESLAVVYGGSVNAENSYGFLREREVDGVLVGSASVKIHEFLAIIKSAAEVISAQGL